MNRSGYHTVSGLVFTLVAALQAARAAMQTSVQIGATSIPVWFSWVATLVAGALAVWAFRSRAA
ncbi:MAG TPA: hypothetical protein VIA45_00615 [Thermoanaerobaculia bacterium]|jgi:hypothetical protein